MHEAESKQKKAFIFLKNKVFLREDVPAQEIDW